MSNFYEASFTCSISCQKMERFIDVTNVGISFLCKIHNFKIMYCNNAGLCIHQSLVMNNYNQSIAIDPVGLSVNLLQYLYSGEIILSRNQSARLFCTKYNYGHVYRIMFTRPFQTCERKPSLLPFVPGRSFGYVESCN